MPYAQINYQDKVGNGSYTIAQIGCLITSFCNLLEDWAIEISPPSLNQFFENKGVYLADPADGAGVKDDLTWGSITAYNPRLVAAKVGNGGWPDTNHAIVKFSYISQHTGKRITHFCKVADPSKHIILDSYDGKVKTPDQYESVYGAPIGWAAYYMVPETPAIVQAVPIPAAAVEPPAPTKPQVPANTVYTRLIEPLTLQVNKNPTHKWDLGFANDAHATSVQDLAQGTVFVAVGKAQRTDGDKPAYFMNADDFGNADTTGVPTNNCGINTVDLEPIPSKTSAIASASSISPNSSNSTSATGEKVDVKVMPTDPDKWKQSYTGFLSPQSYVVNKDEVIQDIEGSQPDQKLTKGALVVVAGIFDKDGYKYYRTVKSVTNNMWYGLPVDSLTREGDISDEELDGLLLDPPKPTPAEITKLSGRDRIIAIAGTLLGFTLRILHLNSKK